MLILYAFNKENYHQGGIPIKDDVLSVAKAVLYFGSKADHLLITDILDLPVLTTFGFFPDRCTSDLPFSPEDLRRELSNLQMEGQIPEDESEFVLTEEYL